ncbi:MAG: hypothetical protein P8M32_06505 [Phycisphaerales bacterium]|nr:hypothetical protein [Phycisphaerae bacterium]MDG2477535.1 hypothetical protein [Phycisphaerales bacterium]
MLIAICPHCGISVESMDARFIAESTDLIGDPVLGSDIPLRFRPTSFNAAAEPIDPGGTPSPRPACPSCRAEWPCGHWNVASQGTES